MDLASHQQLDINPMNRMLSSLTPFGRIVVTTARFKACYVSPLLSYPVPNHIFQHQYAKILIRLLPLRVKTIYYALILSKPEE